MLVGVFSEFRRCRADCVKVTETHVLHKVSPELYSWLKGLHAGWLAAAAATPLCRLPATAAASSKTKRFRCSFMSAMRESLSFVK